MLVGVALGVALGQGCKTNSINGGGGGGETTCTVSGPGCLGVCVEGVCRERCGDNFTCTAPAKCEAIQDVPLCIPPGTRSYPPYAPFDLLAQCQQASCEVPLDSFGAEGMFLPCAMRRFTPDDVKSATFDYAAACQTEAATERAYAIRDRKFWVARGVSGSPAQCDWHHAGVGPAENLVGYACDKIGGATFSRATFDRLVRKGSEVYLWTGGPQPFYLTSDQPIEWNLQLYRFRAGAVADMPSGCKFSPSGASLVASLPEDCLLPTYPRLGGPVTKYAGLWVACDGQFPADCEKNWSGPGLNQSRSALFLRADGLGETWFDAGAAYDAAPARCSVAFRSPGGPQVWMLGREDQLLGGLDLRSEYWAPHDEGADHYLEVFPTAERYNENCSGDVCGSFQGTLYKKIPLPQGFVDPCETTKPLTRF